MAAKVRRQYAGAAAQTSITSSITSGDTSVSIASTTGWPSTALVPFYVVIDPDTSVEEKCSVTISGSTLTLTRGVDGTVAAAHSSGATIYPVFTAIDADEANELASKFTAKGDIVTQGASTFTTTTVGTNDQLLKADSSAAGGVSWATYSPTITLGGDLSGSVTLTNLGSGTLTATVAANSVALGTDTTGNYVATIAGTTNQVSVSGSGSESAAVTLSTPQDIHTGATPTFAGGVFSGSSSGDLLRITQTGAGNALVVEDSANPDSTPFVVNASGQVGIGTNAPTVNFDVYSETAASTMRNSTSGGFLSQIINQRSSDDTSGPLFVARKTRGTTASATAAQSGDIIGTFVFDAHDGSVVRQAATIVGAVDGTVSSAVVPGRLIFNTANTSGTLTERMRIDSAGQVGIGATPSAGDTLRLAKNITGSTNSYGVYVSGAIQSDVTVSARVFRSSPSTANSNFTITAIHHFNALQGTYSNVTAGGAITNQYGFSASSAMTGATNNYGFFGDIASGSNRWNLYMNGTADNYLAGRLGVGATLTSGAMAQVVNTTAADIALIVQGAASQSGDLLSVRNSAATALLTIGSGGQLRTNTSTDVSPLVGVTPEIQLSGTANDASMGINRFSANSDPSRLLFVKSRNATIGSHTVAVDGDNIMAIQALASDGTSYIEAARITASVDGTPGTNDMPGRLVFATTADGGTTLTERMRITNAGNIGFNMSTFSGALVLAIGNGTAPTANPSNGGYLYVESGALKYRGSSGTITTIANA